jgi:hypothetical protein
MAKQATARAVTNEGVVRLKVGKSTPQPEGGYEIEEIERSTVAITLVGLSSLIVNNFSEKAREEMEYLRSLDKEQKLNKRKEGRPPVVPEERFQAARILDQKGRDCVQAYWIKAALESACSYPDVAVKSKVLHGSVFVDGQEQGGLVPIKFDGKVPIMRTDVVRVGKYNDRQPDIRYRPEYRNWSLDVLVTFEPKLVSLGALYHLIRRAGTSVGLCEWRPQKSPAGTFGRFDIAVPK